MLLTLNLNGELMAVMAPLGAAAYVLDVQDSSARVLFAMMQKGEDGIDTLNRVLDAGQNLQWLPVAARPEEQRVTSYPKDAYVSYDFIKVGDIWTAATADLANFLQAMSSLRQLPSTPPSSLAVSAADIGNKKVKTREA